MKTYRSYRKHFEDMGITDEQQMKEVYDFLHTLAELEIEAMEHISLSPTEVIEDR